LEDNLVESGYAYNSGNLTLEHYYQEPADYDWSTYQSKDVCLDGLSVCKFSYSDGEVWQSFWDENSAKLPKAIKMNFKFKDEDKEREFVVNIPIGP